MPSRLALICALFCFACGESTSATGDAPNDPKQDGGMDATSPLPEGVFESDDPTSTKEIQPGSDNTENFGGDDGVNPGELAAEPDLSTLEGDTLRSPGFGASASSTSPSQTSPSCWVATS